MAGTKEKASFLVLLHSNFDRDHDSSLSISSILGNMFDEQAVTFRYTDKVFDNAMVWLTAKETESGFEHS